MSIFFKCLGVKFRHETRNWKGNDITSNETETGKKIKKSKSTTTINDLPLEILDIILQKSCLNCMLGQPKPASKGNLRSFGVQSNSSFLPAQDADDIVLSLCSVDLCWFQRMAKRRFKRNIAKHLTTMSTGAEIIRLNRSYLATNIRPDETFLSLLRSSDVLTKEHWERIHRLHRDRDKNLEILRLVRFRKRIIYESFVRSLRKTDQILVARVLENGGIVAEVRVRYRRRNFTREQQLVQGMNNFRRKDSERPHQVEKILSQLKLQEIEILQSYKDTGIVLWIWCKSKEAFHWLTREIDSENISKTLNQLFVHMSTSILPVNVRKGITYPNPRQDIVRRSAYLMKFTASLNIGGEICSLTKLQGEIYLLCRSYTLNKFRTVLRIYEDQNSFRDRKAIEIKDIKQPVDIIGSRDKNFLYINDLHKSSIWKMAFEPDGSILSKACFTVLGLPVRMSLTSDDHLIIVQSCEPVSFLGIYIQNSNCYISMQLPEEIKNPRYAVETSRGNFVLLHQWREKVNRPNDRSLRMWNISEVTQDGKVILRSFIPPSESQQLIHPYDISIDSDDQVFVSDYYRDRIVLLDYNLKWIRVLCQRSDDSQSALWPGRLFYDQEKKQIIVGWGMKRNGGRVDVYTVSRM